MKRKLPTLIQNLRCERGQDATEYVLLATLIALVVAAGMGLLATSLDRTYSDAAACIQAPSQGGSQGKGGGTGAPGQGKGQGNGAPANPCP